MTLLAWRLPAGGQAPRRPGWWLPLMLPAAAAVLLLVLAVPQFMAALHAVPGNGVLARLQQNQPVGPMELERAARSRLAALAWHAQSQGYGELALLRLHQARAAAGSIEAERWLSESIQAGREALRRNPASPYVWQRLAEALLLRDGPVPAAVEALRMSFQTGPFVRYLLFHQVELSLVLWPVLDPALRRSAALHMQAAAALQPYRLAQLSRRRYSAITVREALTSEPALLRRFDAALIEVFDGS